MSTYTIMITDEFNKTAAVAKAAHKGDAFLICKLLNEQLLKCKSKSTYYVICSLGMAVYTIAKELPKDFEDPRVKKFFS